MNSAVSRSVKRALPGLLAMLLAAPAQAACNQELAIYRDPENMLSLEFKPVDKTAAVTSNAFRMVFREGGVVFDGVAFTTEGISRSHGIVMHQCPEGDVTGAELEKCTVWQGTVYGIDATGRTTLLPAEGQPAAQTILLADFSPVVANAPAFAGTGLTKLPWDAFSLSGCQE